MYKCVSICVSYESLLNTDLYTCFSRSANVQDVLYDARVYSYYLSQFWNVTTCDTNTLLLYSKDDDIVSTPTTTEHYVSNETISILSS